MDQALSWVGDIVRALLQFIPRRIVIRATHRGVRYRWGKKPLEMKPGFHIFWPLVTEVDTIVVARQSLNIPPQVLTTACGKEVSVGGYIVYGISDVVLAIGERNWDVDGTVREIAASAIVSVVAQITFDELLELIKNGSLRKRLRVECRKQLRQYGVSVRDCGLTDFAKCRVHRVIGGIAGQ